MGNSVNFTSAEQKVKAGGPRVMDPDSSEHCACPGGPLARRCSNVLNVH